MLSGPVLAAALRNSHYRLKRFASDLEARAEPYQITERSPLGPTWQYGEEAEPVRYHDGQCLTLADGRVVVAELEVVFEQERVTVDGRLSVETADGDFELLADAGPRQARTDAETAAAISDTVREVTSRVSLLDELGVPARAARVEPVRCRLL